MNATQQTRYPSDMVRPSPFTTSGLTESTLQSVVDYLEDYARAKPIPFALWSLGIGFVLGWKLKPW